MKVRMEMGTRPGTDAVTDAVWPFPDSFPDVPASRRQQAGEAVLAGNGEGGAKPSWVERVVVAGHEVVR